MNEYTLKAILDEALLDEYKARDSYRKILEAFGPMRPFINIVEAEQTHIDMLKPLYERHKLPLPPEPDPDRIQAPESLLDACRLGVEAEIENVAMYDRLIEATEEPDVVEVLKLLQRASHEHHLPAFQRCVERGGTPGRGHGAGRRGA